MIFCHCASGTPQIAVRGFPEDAVSSMWLMPDIIGSHLPDFEAITL
jgi:hypothetical protein